MTSPKRIVCWLGAVLVCGLGSGCQTHPVTSAMGGGYEEVSHPHHNYIALAEPEAPTVSFQYRDSSGKVTEIWPSLYGVGEVIHDGLAIFVGDKAYLEPDRVTHPRLFAVKAPGLPVDITGELVRRWARVAGKNPAVARDRVTLITPEESDGQVRLRFEFALKDKFTAGHDEWPDQAVVEATWPQLDEIMQTVKKRGVEEKDIRWGTPYIADKP